MHGIAAIREEARRDLHREMSVPALYIVPETDPLEVSVRVHRFEAKSDGAGDHAERRDIAPRIIFLREELDMPARGATVSISRGVAYTLADAAVADGVTVTVAAALLPVARTTSLPLPSGRC
jgi:hypothetical protein